ncbi:MAG: glycosyltransferase WbuB [Candidatus Marinimicrobia bacterium]|nr:glycosyltransferase WbuB [Candidatus Neomarinimicrobiota bacterium]
MKNKKINIFSIYFPPENGAASYRIYNLANGFLERDNKVNIITAMPSYPFGRIFKKYKYKIYKKENLSDLNIYRLWIMPSKSKNIFLRFLSMISYSISMFFFIPRLLFIKSDYNIIQGHPLISSFFIILINKKILNRKIILNISDIWPLSGLELGFFKRNSFIYRTLKIIESFNYKNSDKILVQSDEINTYIKKSYNINSFIYRNLPVTKIDIKDFEYNSKCKIFYAGLLGYAQGIAEICKKVDFELLDIEFHIYGDGGESNEIKSFSKNRKNIFYHGLISKDLLYDKIKNYHYGLVPLTKPIYGAFPSKVYELIHFEIPIIYFGDGNASKLITEKKIGYSVNSKDYDSLKKLFNKISLVDNSFIELTDNLKNLKKNGFDFKLQFENFLKYIE